MLDSLRYLMGDRLKTHACNFDRQWSPDAKVSDTGFGER